MTRNAQLFTQHSKQESILSGKAHWAFIASAALTLVVCVAADSADAANARSNAGLQTNNNTYIGFGNNMNTDTSLSSAARSDVHTRPLAVDSGAHANVRANTYSYTPPAAPYVAQRAYVAPSHTTVTQQGRVVTTVREEGTPNYAVTPTHRSSYGDVNARNDAGVIVTHPVTSTTPVYSNATGGVNVHTQINP